MYTSHLIPSHSIPWHQAVFDIPNKSIIRHIIPNASDKIVTRTPNSAIALEANFSCRRMNKTEPAHTEKQSRCEWQCQNVKYPGRRRCASMTADSTLDIMFYPELVSHVAGARCIAYAGTESHSLYRSERWIGTKSVFNRDLNAAKGVIAAVQ